MLQYNQPIESNGETDSLKLQQPKITLGAKFRKVGTVSALKDGTAKEIFAVLSYGKTFLYDVI